MLQYDILTLNKHVEGGGGVHHSDYQRILIKFPAVRWEEKTRGTLSRSPMASWPACSRWSASWGRGGPQVMGTSVVKTRGGRYSSRGAASAGEQVLEEAGEAGHTASNSLVQKCEVLFLF